jgi:hypothetical protein
MNSGKGVVSRMKRLPLRKSLAFFSIMFILLTGCSYPNELRQENRTNPEEFIAVVQSAVEQFRERQGGMLPIKNSDENTPLYEKYKIDFKKLQKYRLLTNIPANAYESGGSYLYVIVNAETDPKVKLLDMASYQSVNLMQTKVSKYSAAHGGALPKGEQVADGIYYLDFDKLGEKRPELFSVYNRQNLLTYLVQDSGIVTLDYAFDLMRIIETKGLKDKLQPKLDLRELLVQYTPFVPNQSVFYRWDKDQPLPSLR